MSSSRTDKSSVTYLVQGENGGPIKIGLSNHTGLGQRVSALQTGYPHRLRVVKLLDGNHEARLHHEFAAHRLHGEWFSPAPELLAFCGPDASPAGYEDFRAGFEAGYHAALQSVQVSLHRTFEYLEEPRTVELAVQETLGGTP